MIIDKEYSLKPFGSGTSCIDCIHGECIRNVSMEECKKICEESDWCGCGIHVDFENKSIPSYCLPFNTVEYKNRPLATSLISTEKNGTYLSRENGVDITFFREKDQFPSIEETYNQLKSNLIFNYDIINFLSMDGKFFQSFLPSTFDFLNTEISDFYMVIKGFDFSQGEVTRIHNQDIVYFFYKETTLVLTYDFNKNQFIWENYTDEKTNQTNIFYIETNNSENFINSISMDTGVFIYLLHHNEKYYLYKTNDNKLGISKRKPKEVFFITNKIKTKNIDTISTKKLFENRVKYMNHNMKVYLDTYFPDKTDFHTSLSFQKFGILHKCILFIIFLLILVFIFKP